MGTEPVTVGVSPSTNPIGISLSTELVANSASTESVVDSLQPQVIDDDSDSLRNHDNTPDSLLRGDGPRACSCLCCMNFDVAHQPKELIFLLSIRWSHSA